VLCLDCIHGGVVSERQVNHCGVRPRPTGRDTNLNTCSSDTLGNRVLAGMSAGDFKSLIEPDLTIEASPQGR
jgi:hypothetical protein